MSDDKNVNKSREILLVAGYHGINVAPFSLEQTNLSFEVLDFLRQELYQILEVLSFFLKFILLGHIIVLEKLLVCGVKFLL